MLGLKLDYCGNIFSTNKSERKNNIRKREIDRAGGMNVAKRLGIMIIISMQNEYYGKTGLLKIKETNKKELD